MTLLTVTYTISVREGISSEICQEARDLYKFSLLKNQRRMEAVTNSLVKRLGPDLKGATLAIEVGDGPVD